MTVRFLTFYLSHVQKVSVSLQRCSIYKKTINEIHCKLLYTKYVFSSVMNFILQFLHQMTKDSLIKICIFLNQWLPPVHYEDFKLFQNDRTNFRQNGWKIILPGCVGCDDCHVEKVVIQKFELLRIL